MQIIHHLTMDMVRQLPMTPVGAVQNDANTRAVEMRLLENGTPWVIPQGITAAVAFRKGDGSRGLYDRLPDGSAAITINGSTVTAILAPQALTCPGTVSAAIVFFDGALNRLAAFPFAIRVERDPSAGQGISNDYYRFSTMEQVSAALEDFLSKAEEALQVVKDTATEDAPAIVCQATGEIITVADASDRVLHGLSIFGRTTQNGTPAPNATVPLEYAGKNGSVHVTVTGKNLLPSKMLDTAVAGVTFKTNGDGTITAKGTGTTTSVVTSFADVVLPAGTYTYSCGFSGQNYLNLQIYEVVDSQIYKITDQIGSQISSKAFTLDKLATVRVRIIIYAGAVDCTIKPQLELGNMETAYEPYAAQTAAFSIPNGLPGIPVTRVSGNDTDAKGQKWICDTIDFTTGIYTKRVETKVLTGTENWKQCSPETWFNYTYYWNTGNGSISGYDRNENYCLCNQYRPVSRAGIQGVTTADRCSIGANGNEFNLTSNLATAEEFKAELARKYAEGNPVIIQYVLAKPIETPLSAQELAAYAALRTNKPNTTVFNDVGADLALAYVADTKTYIDNQLAAISAAILNC